MGIDEQSALDDPVEQHQDLLISTYDTLISTVEVGGVLRSASSHFIIQFLLGQPSIDNQDMSSSAQESNPKSTVAEESQHLETDGDSDIADEEG